MLLLGLGVHLEKGRQARPHGGQRVGVGGIDLFHDGEQPPLLLVIVEYQLGDVHGPPGQCGEAGR